MLTSIIIPTVFNDQALQRCLARIKEHTGGDYEILVMDNGSQPRGCVRAMNRGLLAADGDVLVCMNDDCQPQAGWLDPLRRAILDEGMWLVCPEWRYARIAGHCMVFSREAYQFTGGFDERYRHCSADHHFECVLAQAGKPIRQVIESQVIHDPGDPLRIHFRKSQQVGDHERLPNTGQWYLDDNEAFHAYWRGVVPSDFWPSDWTKVA